MREYHERQLRKGRCSLLEPAQDVGHHLLLAEVIERVVVSPFVQLERLILGSGPFVEVLASAGLAALSAVPGFLVRKKRDLRQGLVD